MTTPIWARMSSWKITKKTKRKNVQTHIYVAFVSHYSYLFCFVFGVWLFCWNSLLVSRHNSTQKICDFPTIALFFSVSRTFFLYISLYLCFILGSRGKSQLKQIFSHFQSFSILSNILFNLKRNIIPKKKQDSNLFSCVTSYTLFSLSVVIWPLFYIQHDNTRCNACWTKEYNYTQQLLH